MAVSTCVKCSAHGFELALFTPIGESQKIMMVQCSSCGTPVGILNADARPLIDVLRSQCGRLPGLARRCGTTAAFLNVA
jgi:hypothetical protein